MKQIVALDTPTQLTWYFKNRYTIKLFFFKKQQQLVICFLGQDTDLNYLLSIYFAF